jgi:hypothetical protein
MTDWLLWIGIAMMLVALAALARDDLPHWSRRRIRVEGEVVGHRSMRDDEYSYAAVMAFTASDGRRHEVVDSHYRPTRRPEAGAKVALVYPEGLPDKARVGRPLWRFYAYAMLACMLAILVARAAGWLGEGVPL